MKVTILGTGAIGSYFAMKLAQVPENEITCVVKSAAHAEAINKDGIIINEPDGTVFTAKNVRALTDTAGESPADLVLIAVKSHVTEQAVLQHKALFGTDTVVLTLQNGYGNHDDIQKVADPSHIVIGTTSLGANVREDGSINHAGEGTTVIGALAPDTEAGKDAAKLCEKLLKDAAIDVEVTDDVLDAVFRKLLVNIAINALCTLGNCENKYITADQEMRRHAKLLVNEAIDILDIVGYTYDKDEIWFNIERVVKKTEKNICSMLQDARAGRSTEIDRINGAIVEMARKEHVDAPLNREIKNQIHMRFGE